MDDRRMRGTLLLLLALGISLLFFRMIQSFAMALLLAGIFASLAHPTYRRVVQGVKGRETLGAALTLILGVVLLFVPFMGLVAVVAQEAAQISAEVDPWVRQYLNQPNAWREWLESVPWLAKLAPYQDEILAKAGELGGSLAGFAVTGLASGTRGTARFFLLLFVMFYAMFFFLKEGRSILDRTLGYVPLPSSDKHRMLETFTTVTRATLKGTGIIGIVQGALGGVSFAIAGITGPVFWAVLMAILSIIPGIGPAVIWVPAVIYLVADGRIGAAIAVGLWCFLVVSTVDNLLRPWLVGKETKMPDLLVLLGTLGGLVMFGAVGVVVGPIIAALFITVWELFGSASNQLQTTAEASSRE